MLINLLNNIPHNFLFSFFKTYMLRRDFSFIVLLKFILMALLLTVVIEVTISIIVGYRKKSEILTIILINLITNPIINFFLLTTFRLQTYQERVQQYSIKNIIFIEIGVILIEWLLLMFALRQSPKKLLALSILINFCSYFGGVLIMS